MEMWNSRNIRLDVRHITRVEGHGNIVVDMQDGVLEQCDLQIVEAPRFFEAMMRGRPYEHASHIASRICGICAVSHATASLRACENALGVQPSNQTIILRQLNLYGELLDSHILHIYMLVAPDFLGLGSVIPLAEVAPDIMKRALRMKKVAGDLCAIMCGRHTHPIAMTVGGFTHFPSPGELEGIRQRLAAMRDDLDATVALFDGLTLPSFERETEYIALHREGAYCLWDGSIQSSDGGTWDAESYQDVTNEFIVPHSTAKHARNHRGAYMVGALARFNINHHDLHPRAKEVAADLGLRPMCCNPYWISVAQLVECVHSAEKAIEIVDHLLATGIAAEEPAPISRRSGEGVGACEAPRGTLFHHYRIDGGVISQANCVIPTAQNLGNIEADMRELVPRILDRSPDDIRRRLEMLVRAYDPCISCSAHTLEISFV